jgi:lysine 2,3-aminomutase
MRESRDPEGSPTSAASYHAPAEAALPTISGTPPRGPVVGRPEILGHRPDLAPVWAAADAQFPVKVTRDFWSRIDPADPDDPLARQVLPHPDELIDDPVGLDDPVGDRLRSPTPWIVHKYPSRVLWLLTKRCHLMCRYCFRRDHQPGEREDPTPEEWSAAVDYLRTVQVDEVILSGGDPLACPDRRLWEAIAVARGAAPVVRIHTRAPITAPSRVTPELVAGLRERAPVWVVVHCNHPRELSPTVDGALARLVDAGIPVLNQSVLLRGVNDDVEVLAELCRQLVRRRVFPYYLHHPDQVRHTSHFRVSAEEGMALWDGLSRRVSGVALPRYVWDPPEGTGKRDVARRDAHRGSSSG